MSGKGDIAMSPEPSEPIGAEELDRDGFVLDLWDAVANEYAVAYPDQFRTYLTDVRPVRVDGGELVLSCEDERNAIVINRVLQRSLSELATAVVQQRTEDRARTMSVRVQ